MLLAKTATDHVGVLHFSDALSLVAQIDGAVERTDERDSIVAERHAHDGLVQDNSGR